MPPPTIAQKSPIVKKMPAGTYWWCTCGLSKNQPFCDGAHKGSDFAPQKVVTTEEHTTGMLGCKSSPNGTNTDGEHKKL